MKTLSEAAGMPNVADLSTQFATAKSNILEALKRKLGRRDISTISSSVYYFLDRLKLLPFTIPEKLDILADAKRELIADLKFKLTITTRRADRQAIKKDIAAYTKSIIEHAPLDDRLQTLAKMCARKLALDAFLNNIILNGLDLDALMESRKEVFLEAGP